MPTDLPPQLLDAVKKYQPRKAVLFGSTARGSADRSSDIDLLLIKDTPQSFVQRLKEFALLLPSDLPRVDAFIYTPEEFARMRDAGNPLVSAALADGRTIYEAPTSGA